MKRGRGALAFALFQEPPRIGRPRCLENPRPKGGILTSGERLLSHFRLNQHSPSFKSVDAFVEALQQTCDSYVEDFADSKQSRHGDGPPGFNLLPVPRREPERDHVFLAVALGFPQVTDSCAQSGKEFRLI
jgi:hypothetical protein